MKLITAILFFLPLGLSATTYYVSNAGNDANNGTSTNTPWRTIAKINAFAFSINDSIKFNDGDSWNEKLIPSISNLYFGSYSTGDKPIITAFQTLGGFSNVGGNIWRAIATNSVDSLKVVLINGVMAHKSRLPNATYLTYIPASSNQNKIVGTLTGTPDYTGDEIVVRDKHWIIQVSKISSQSTGTLNLSIPLQYVPDCTGYFIQNDSALVDTLNEYSFNYTTKSLIVYSVGSPTVQISTIDTISYIHNVNSITFDGISFQGANKKTISLETTRFITIRNCAVNYSGEFAIFGRHAPHTIISNDSIQNSLSNAIYLADLQGLSNPCDSSFVDGNYIKNVGVLAGMGLTLNAYTGIFTIGDSSKVSNNRMDSVGYIGYQFYGKKTFPYRNYITNFCLLKDDGGGIYTITGTPGSTINDGSVIRGNILINGIGALNGTTGVAASSAAAGIYMDEQSRQLTADSNSISNCYFANIFLHDASVGIVLYANTCVDSLGANLFINTNSITTSNKRNTYYSQSASQYIISIISGATFGTSDSNYYLRPILTSNLISQNNSTYSLAQYQGATGFDINTTGVPVAATSTTPLFYFNETQSDKVIPLTGYYVDQRGVSYNSTITLTPFTSILLFPSAAPAQYIITGSTKSRGYKFR